MKRSEKIAELKSALEQGMTIKEITLPLGGGEYCIEVSAVPAGNNIYDSSNGEVILFELVGSNGSDGSEADDLSYELSLIWAEARVS